MLEMVWSRPTFDVNGIIGGYTGKGSKTVLPAQASAKFSFRLVGNQDPAKIAESFRSYVKKNLPADCRAEFISHGASRALQLPFSSESLSRAARALQAEWGKEPVFRRVRRLDPDRRQFQGRPQDGYIDDWLLASKMIASIRQTKNMNSPRSTKAREAGRGFCRRWRFRARF